MPHRFLRHDYDLLDVHRVVDGDTVDLLIDIGFHLTFTARFRLVLVDTPERGEPGWHAARDFVCTWLNEHAFNARVQTHKTDSFGRWLADIYLPDGESLSSALLREGHAQTYIRR